MHEQALIFVYTSFKPTLSPALHLTSIKLANRSGFIAERLAVNISEAALKARSTDPDDAATLTTSLPISLNIANGPDYLSNTRGAWWRKGHCWDPLDSLELPYPRWVLLSRCQIPPILWPGHSQNEVFVPQLLLNIVTDSIFACGLMKVLLVNLWGQK